MMTRSQIDHGRDRRRGHLPLDQHRPHAGLLAKNERGLWEFPGGAVEFGERLADALRREIHEEYGIEIVVGELLDVADHILTAEGQHWVSPSYICRIVSGTPSIREPGKCSAIAWFTPDAMPVELTEVTRVNLENYLKRRLASVSC